MKIAALSLFLLGLLMPQAAEAFWRLPCASPVLTGRVDSIVGPFDATKPAGHVHTIMGANAMSQVADYDTLQKSTCTTCKVIKDKSAYWIPLLYYQFDNGTFAAVDHGGMLVYYLQRNANASVPLRAFPPGYKMLTGNPMARSNLGTDESKGISWNCINYDHPTAETPNMANTNCPQGLRAQVFFPSCWDGKNLDSPDHKSHTAYLSGINAGHCPPSHPVQTVSIFYEVYYNVKKFNDMNLPGKFVLANGDPTGYGLHGDFLNGWDEAYLQKAVNTCTADSGVIEDCPVFAGGMYADADMGKCKAVNPFPQEDPFNPGTKLLGCNPVTNGPATAKPSCPPAAGSSSSSTTVASSGGAAAATSTAAGTPAATNTADAGAATTDVPAASGSGSASSGSSTTGTRVTRTRCRAKATV